VADGERAGEGGHGGRGDVQPLGELEIAVMADRQGRLVALGTVKGGRVAGFLDVGETGAQRQARVLARGPGTRGLPGDDGKPGWVVAVDPRDVKALGANGWRVLFLVGIGGLEWDLQLKT